MRLAVVAAGKLRDAGLQSLCDDYSRRIQPFAPLEVIEVRDAAGLRARWSDRARGLGPRVLLDERGEQLGSRDLSRWLEAWRASGVRQVSFYIGDADGFADPDRAGAERLLALSRLTLPHRLARLILLEQLYRAATLLAGHPYHHD
ncbi:MAG: 23S rRNA (pseudouridine(1915)-N(3))-methyltransferase RlmH [Myxococcales bacterium]|nr:23S rRNA (pseudouridine(1915)-N(3))-methyltransferase RlmH [Myxococcales bacterium]